MAVRVCGEDVRRRRAGRTLLELMITLLLAATLMAAAVPSLHRLVVGDRLATVDDRVLQTLLAARQVAVTRGVSVTFCAGPQGWGCTGDWSRGRWIVFEDHDRDGRIGSADTLISSNRSGEGDVETQMDGNGPFRKAVVFMPSGMAQRLSVAFAAGRIRVCTPTEISPNATELVLSATGRVRAERHDFGGDCPPL